MKLQDAREQITRLLADRRPATMTGSEIATALKLRGKSKKSLQKWLVQLVRNGDVAMVRQNRYSLPRSTSLVSGILQTFRSGNGFVLDGETGREIHVLHEDQGRALRGDEVRVRISDATSPGRRRSRPVRRPSSFDATGTVVQVLARSERDIVTTLAVRRNVLVALPLDARYRCVFRIPDPREAKVGDRVVIRFSTWPARSKDPEGTVLEVLGPAGDPSVDTLSIIRQYALPGEFGTSVLDEAERSTQQHLTAKGRSDLRKNFLITIDPVTARDFDDAVSLETDPDGHRRLGVHIADVSHFVKQDGIVDREARVRGNSVYLPDKVIPMLPESLSNGVCSLRPDEDRYAVSVFLTLDKNGKILGRSFSKSIIRSKRRLTYEEVLPIINPGKAKAKKRKTVQDPRTIRLLKDLHALAQTLRARRMSSHALEIDMPEPEIIMDGKGSIRDVRLVENDVSHQLIEECMIAANEAVAQALYEAGTPVISRFHDVPAEEKIGELTKKLRELGYKPGNLLKRHELAGFLKSLEKDPMASYVRTLVLRSMKKAVYSASSKGHFGLAKKHYAHFTSPIRRYPDLVLHRALEKQILSTGGAKRTKGGAGYTRKDLANIAENASLTEQTAAEAERDLTQLMTFRYLETQLAKKVVKSYDAFVVEVTRFGLFVEIPKLQIQGLVHRDSLGSDGRKRARFSQDKHVLQKGKTAYRRGQELRVYVVRVDHEKRQLDFGLARK